ncbi:2Fe-2S iron-sulfur cluster binding domain-containing protein [Streptomyces sp. 8P21H-1]|nr:2Fe-2S iron-sulfur cluster binding domain-containing protein [Streptomyces sp. 8P21H-1]
MPIKRPTTTAKRATSVMRIAFERGVPSRAGCVRSICGSCSVKGTVDPNGGSPERP